MLINAFLLLILLLMDAIVTAESTDAGATTKVFTKLIACAPDPETKIVSFTIRAVVYENNKQLIKMIIAINRGASLLCIGSSNPLKKEKPGRLSGLK